jgi:hypothetical protein
VTLAPERFVAPPPARSHRLCSSALFLISVKPTPRRANALRARDSGLLRERGLRTWDPLIKSQRVFVSSLIILQLDHSSHLFAGTRQSFRAQAKTSLPLARFCIVIAVSGGSSKDRNDCRHLVLVPAAARLRGLRPSGWPFPTSYSAYRNALLAKDLGATLLLG